MSTSEKEVAWSLYWSQDQLHSCVASECSQDQQFLNELWVKFASGLAQQAKVLDLATGNGAVPSALLSARSDLQIDAVDRADIDPMKYLSSNESLKKVRFHANTNILKMQFDEYSFDAITSQFGIEYAGLQKAIIKNQSLLKPGGKMLFFIHHQNSALIEASKLKLSEIVQLTSQHGLLASLKEFISDGYNLNKLNAAGEAYLSQNSIRSNAVTGQVFAGVEQVIQLLAEDEEKAKLLSAGMNVRIRAEQQRLEQMVASSQTEEDLQRLINLLEKQKVAAEFEPLLIDDQSSPYLLCWKFSAEKNTT